MSKFQRISYGCVLTYDSLLALNLMLRVKQLPIKTLFLSGKPLVVDKRTIKTLGDLKYLKKRFTKGYLNYLTRFVFALPFKIKMANLFKGARAQLHTVDRLQKQFGFEVRKFKDFNSPEAIEFLSGTQSDLFVSLCLDQILKSEFIKQVPCINIHPSLLPDFRGVDPFVQQRLTGQPSGATLHELTEKVDSGDILLMEEYAVEEDDRIDDMHFKFIHTAVGLLDRYCNQQVTPIPQGEVQFKYRSWPTREELERLPKRFFQRKKIDERLDA